MYVPCLIESSYQFIGKHGERKQSCLANAAICLEKNLQMGSKQMKILAI